MRARRVWRAGSVGREGDDGRREAPDARNPMLSRVIGLPEILIVLGSDEAVERGGLGVVRIAELVGREKSQVSRALSALASSGLVDRDPASRAYVRSKDKMCLELGMHSVKQELPAATRQADLIALVQKLNADPGVHAPK